MNKFKECGKYLGMAVLGSTLSLSPNVKDGGLEGLMAQELPSTPTSSNLAGLGLSASTDSVIYLGGIWNYCGKDSVNDALGEVLSKTSSSPTNIVVSYAQKYYGYNIKSQSIFRRGFMRFKKTLCSLLMGMAIISPFESSAQNGICS